jgi:uncharacterized membrane protein YdjX (TVP38/TMEM64 family)
MSQRVIVGVLVAAAIVAFFAFGAGRYLDPATLDANRDVILAFASDHFVAALAIAFGIYAGVAALSIPGTAALAIATGFVFGRAVGVPLTVLAATTGATAAFLLARYLFADAARRRLGPRAARISEGFARHAVPYMLFVRLVPVFPFFLVNLAAAFTPISLRTFAGSTAVGIVPLTFVYVNLGHTLGGIESPRDLVSVEMASALALLAALALLPVLVARWRAAR